MHTPQFDCSFTLYDNQSNDEGLASLLEYVNAKQMPLIQSGFNLETKYISHGEILGRFVLEQTDCSHYLFLDSDVCFIEPETIDTMLAELGEDDRLFGIGPRWSFDGIHEVPKDVRGDDPQFLASRLPPYCALVKNTPLFRLVVKAVGLTAGNSLWAERKEYLDTFALMTRVMRTHGLTYRFSSKMVYHFSAVSYKFSANAVNMWKTRQRDERLAVLRASSF
jgi:hypothetical protein